MDKSTTQQIELKVWASWVLGSRKIQIPRNQYSRLTMSRSNPCQSEDRKLPLSVAQTLKNRPAGVQETQVPSLGQEVPPGEMNDNPLQYSWLENPTDRGAWWAEVYVVTKNQTQ